MGRIAATAAIGRRVAPLVGVLALLALLAGTLGPRALAAQTAAAAHRPAFTGRRPFTPGTRPKPSNQPRFPGKAGVPSPWLHLTNAPPSGFIPGSMMVMTDGTVLIHEDYPSGSSGTGKWEKLTPDSTGSYVNGTWSAVASMPSGYQPLYYASQILPTGQLLVEGGEYNGSNTEVWTNQGAIYNPLTNTWASVSPPSTWLNIGDAQSVMLPTATGNVWNGGQFMMAHPFDDGSGNSGMADALFNSNGTWTNIPGTGKLDRNDEEGWTLLPNDRVLTVDIEHNWNGTTGGKCSPCTSELFNPATNAWSPSGNVPVDLPSYVGPNGPSEEMGPVVTQPSGLAFAIGGNDATATYNPATGTWTGGPTLPNNQDSADGAASILPDGNVLFVASPGVFNTPMHFFVWNGSTITQVADTANAPSDSSYVTRFVVLPTGQVMFDDATGDIEIYNGDQTFTSSWAPTITSVSSTALLPGSTYSLAGTQLSGRSGGGAYGDDNQSATNYPLVRITNDATHVVTYARTSGFSYSIAAGAQSSTGFTVPASTPIGASTLQVVANGIPSAAQAVSIGAVFVANPGPQTTTAGTAASLQIQASAGDGGTLSYSATGLPPGLSISSTTGKITGTPTTTGSYTVKVTVTDSKGEPSGSASFTWAITAVSVTNPGPQAGTVGNAASLQIAASDSDGGTLSYSATGLPPGLSISSTGKITGTPTTIGSFAVKVTVADSKGSPSNSASFTWRINSITVTNPGPQTGKVGTAASLQIAGSDSDGGTLSYSATGLPPGLSIASATGKITGTPTTAGSFTVTVTATDAKGGSRGTSFTWAISAVSITNPGAQTGTVGSAASLQITASDSDGGTLSYSATGLPPGLSIASTTGKITGNPTAAGSFTVKVTVADSKGSPSNSTSFTWSISAVSVTNPGAQTGTVGNAASLQIAASASDGGTLSYSATGLPPGLSIASTTGKITGTPTTTGTYTVKVTVTDSKGSPSNSTSFTWTVNSITVTNPGAQTSAVGTAASLQIAASDSNGGTLSYSATGLPPGLSIASATGKITGTPTTVGTFNPTITATDAKGGSRGTSFTWAISAVSITNPGPQTTPIGIAASLQITASDSDGGTLSYSATGLPNGLAISSTTGKITGTPTTTGTSTVTVTVADSKGGPSNHSSFTWTVNSVTVTNPGPQTGTVGTAASLQITASDSDGGALSYSATGLPPGLSIASATGKITGTPTTAGSFNVTVNATDAKGGSNHASFTWTVNSITVTNPGAQTGTLRTATSLQIKATDSDSGALSYSATGLPPGLSIASATGDITGTPTTSVGAYRVTVTAADAKGGSSSTSFTWTIKAPSADGLLISELRLTGPGGGTDRYVDLVNSTGSAISLSGWTFGVASAGTSTTSTLSGSIPAGGHLLVADTGYQQVGPSAADAFFPFGVAANGGVQLVDPSGDTVDSVGFSGAPAGYSLGTGLALPSTLPAVQFTWVRNYAGTTPVDTYNNGSDFTFVAVGNNDATHGNPELGAPGPDDLGSPVIHNDVLQAGLYDPSVSATSSPNQITGSGTLIYNRTITNCAGQPTTGACAHAPAGTTAKTFNQLRFRITGLSTFNSPGGSGQGVLKADSSSGETGITGGNSCASFATSVQGLPLDPPSTSGDGGLNSTWTTTNLGPGGLAPGACVNVEFEFNVATSGTFSFAYSTEGG